MTTKSDELIIRVELLIDRLHRFSQEDAEERDEALDDLVAMIVQELDECHAVLMQMSASSRYRLLDRVITSLQKLGVVAKSLNDVMETLLQ